MNTRMRFFIISLTTKRWLNVSIGCIYTPLLATEKNNSRRLLDGDVARVATIITVSTWH